MDPWIHQAPFLRSASGRPADIWTDELFGFLWSHGLDSFSVSALARQLRVTPAAVLQRQSRRDLLVEVVLTFGTRWLWWCAPAMLDSDLPGRLPRDEHDQHGVRVWQALREVARGLEAAGDPEANDHVRWVREEEAEATQHRLGSLLDRDSTPDETSEVLVLLDGLRSDLSAPNPRLTVNHAESVLVDHVRRLNS